MGVRKNYASKSIISVKVILLNFFGYLMTSGVKDPLIKVVDNSAKFMHKNVLKNIMTGSWVKTFQSYNFILNDFIDKMSVKVILFQKISVIQWPLGSKIILDNSVKYMYKKFHKNIMTDSFVRTFQSYNFILNYPIDKDVCQSSYL